MTRATLTDIADRVGLSVATVSYALNGRPGVSEANRARILALAAELGYRPNRLAQGLRTGLTRTLGMLVEDIANPFSADLASSILRAAQVRGFQVFVSHTQHNTLELSDFESLRDSGVEGVILSSVVNFNDGALLQQVVEQALPLVQVIRHVPGVDADFVGIDDRAAAAEAARHLASLGIRDVGIIAGPPRSPTSQLRLEGFRNALSEIDHPLPKHRVVACEYSLEDGRRGAQLLCRHGPPQAILCGSDLLAFGAIDALVEQNLRVPEDVGVVGFDDMALASMHNIQLTTVRQPRRELGEAALETLIRRIEGHQGPTQHVVVPHTLVVRASCGAQLAAQRVKR